MAVTINSQSIMVKLSKAPKLKAEALRRADLLVEQQKQVLLNDFDKHVVTRELEQGAEGPNISKTLKGLSPRHGGNLFSFIGFFDTDGPTHFIREALEKFVKILNRNQFFNRFAVGNKIEIGFRVNVPTLAEINALGGDEAAFPDGYTGGFWLDALEEGNLTGLSHYIYDPAFGTYSQSRSGTGLQAKGGGKMITIRDGDKATKIKYVSALLEKFAKSLGRKR